MVTLGFIFTTNTFLLTLTIRHAILTQTDLSPQIYIFSFLVAGVIYVLVQFMDLAKNRSLFSYCSNVCTTSSAAIGVFQGLSCGE
jgi:hypothetical protein